MEGTTGRRGPAPAEESAPASGADLAGARRDGARLGGGAGSGTASGLIAVTMWGLAPVATRALVLQLAPLPLLVLRVALAGADPAAGGRSRCCAASTGRHAPRLIAAGLLGMVGYNLPVTLGLRWVPASTAALILATEPIWILVLSRVFLAERGAALVLGRGRRGGGRGGGAGRARGVRGRVRRPGPRRHRPGPAGHGPVRRLHDRAAAAGRQLRRGARRGRVHRGGRACPTWRSPARSPRLRSAACTSAAWGELAFLAAGQHGRGPAAVERGGHQGRPDPGRAAALPGAAGRRDRRGGTAGRGAVAAPPWPAAC